jgi:hypothetical protein
LGRGDKEGRGRNGGLERDKHTDEQPDARASARARTHTHTHTHAHTHAHRVGERERGVGARGLEESEES